ncbi:MAG: M24 family metallopeptidase [Oceanospirillaceae bacterium]|nr:M24 family metallopeptidase [Oceanospirillaceae bacterium]
MQMPSIQSFADNGRKAPGTFSKSEYNSRHTAIRALMSARQIDAVLFSSYHNICYYADFLYCYFGRNYALVIDQDNVTSVSAGIDGGQPWRRTRGDNITYTDWHKDNFFIAIKQLTKNVRRLGIEFDHCTLDQLAKLKQAFPNIEFVDIAAATMSLRMIKSSEEIIHIKKMTRIADIGGAACVEAAKVGVSEAEVALHSTATMVREIAKVWPDGELLDTWTWFQSGLNTDGAHNPVTSRRIEQGDILSLNCFPMVAGYYVALERTLFAGSVNDEQLRLWEINCLVHERGKALLVAGNKCSEIAAELNQLYAEYDLLQYRSFGYGHSFGILSHYYGREAGLELREDCDTVLLPGMVISMEPMITIPNHLPGAGGYREHDILVITEQGNENITQFPYGPEHLVIT